jgi:4-amino-4-deoxy-L-arabinose transferase-like glycosyltransferase
MPTRRVRTRPRALLPALLTGAFCLLALVRNLGFIRDGFDGLYGQDPYAYLDYIERILALFRDGQALGKVYYPLGFPLIGAVGYRLAGIAGLQGTVIIVGALSIGVTGLIAYEIGRGYGLGRTASLIAQSGAALVMLACPQLTQSSIVIMSDVPALFWALLSAWGILRYWRTGSGRWAALAAVALALAVMTRWVYALLALPYGLVLLLGWLRGAPRFRWRTLALIIGMGLLTYAPQIVMNLLDPTPIAGNRIIWSVSNFAAHDFSTGDGASHFDDPPAVYYLLPFRSPYYTSTGFLPLTVLGALLLLRRPLLAVFVLGWGAVGYLYLAGIPVENIRYALFNFTPLALATGLSIGWLIEMAIRAFQTRTIAALHWQWLLRRAGAAAALLVAFALVTTAAAQSGQHTTDLFARFLPIKQADQAVLRWLRQVIPPTRPPAAIYCLELCLPLAHYNGLLPIQVYDETDKTLEARPAPAGPTYALFNLAALDMQWKDRAPQMAFRWLRDHTPMQRVGTFDAYTLFQISP